MTEKRKPTPWLWWTVAGLMLLVAYPLSMGPVSWWLSAINVQHGDWKLHAAQAVYWPLGQLAEIFPAFGEAVQRYCKLWLP